VLIATGEIGVGEADVAKLVYELVVRLHEVQPAGGNVANVQRDVVTDPEQILRLVTNPTPYAEETLSPAPRHVLDGHGYALRPGFLECPHGPACERSSRGRRVDDDDGGSNPTGQLRYPRESLAGRKSLSAAIKESAQGEDGDAVLVR